MGQRLSRMKKTAVRKGHAPSQSETFNAVVPPELMRAIPLSEVDLELWSCNLSDEGIASKMLQKSKPCKTHGADLFVSHSWYCDKGDDLDRYFTAKEAELVNQLKDHVKRLKTGKKVLEGKIMAGGVAARSKTPGELKKNVTLWIDRACIPQHDIEKKTACVANLENFMASSKGLIVLLSTRYLRRLWCLFEWACFLKIHSPGSIFVGFWCFRDTHDDGGMTSTFINAIRSISVEKCEVAFESDRTILMAKVTDYYTSPKAFERYVQLTMIALIVRDLLVGIGKYSDTMYKDYITPLLDLADELEHVELTRALKSFKAVQSWEKAHLKSMAGQEGGMTAAKAKSDLYMADLEDFLEGTLYPYLEREKVGCLH